MIENDLHYLAYRDAKAFGKERDLGEMKLIMSILLYLLVPAFYCIITSQSYSSTVAGLKGNTKTFFFIYDMRGRERYRDRYIDSYIDR